ncbi:TatD family deoxyribonuclease [Candidatus Mancarchaeum acidiphilum]|uniref:TatD family deoxyribonuclease n=1 Tax=Candidatus Mancarchaeum acidiphilum TaxID=1920749 RepID=A0A218NNR3_9ARCH|nr:TatD family hydrolase [Candidatus Mancarchaeum acidiphilum]ASI14117.1 TatD family deoxyribonuclease [Candidatus Mancarchaeum acidiphilum]
MVQSLQIQSQTRQKKEQITGEIRVFNIIDAHCHLDQLKQEDINDSLMYIAGMVTNGVDMPSNIRNLELADNKHIFACLGIHPEFAASLKKYEVDYVIDFIKRHSKSIKGIGEIGLDYKFASQIKGSKPKQRSLFLRMLTLANKLDLPVTVHSREAMDEVLYMLHKKKVKKAHIHFFEGTVEQAMKAVEYGYMISIPPLPSSKRNAVIKAVPMKNLMAETDSPTAGSLPKDVIYSIELIAKAKGMGLEETAKELTINTRRFFNIGEEHNSLLRSEK